jgi:hypothetical protein
MLSVVVALSATLVLSSCAMPADDPNFVEGETVVGEETVADPAADPELLASAFLAPTSIGVDVPLTAPPAAGSLIVSLSDGSEFDALLNTSMAEAAAAIGWEFTEIPGAETVESAPAAFEEALALQPAGIRISGAYVDVLATLTAMHKMLCGVRCWQVMWSLIRAQKRLPAWRSSRYLFQHL